MEAAQYLRKSRMEEGLETEEVLSRHRQALHDYAAANGIHIVETYNEVISGESLFARPEMLRLLQDVEDGKYEAVLVMDLDRLSRGRMKDQGIILDAFRDSGTLIITPEKTYDLSDELDDEMAEFKTFMSRREYKIINKRLRRGLQQSIQEGCYVANAPYGYRRVTVDKKPTLEIVPEEARFVAMMYDLYIDGYGCTAIARHINALGAHPRRAPQFNRSTVAKILQNPTYTGKIVWDQKKHIKKGTRGNPKHITIYQPREKWTITDGLHPAIIDKAKYDLVQSIFAKRYIPSKNDGTIKSPLAGLVKCTACGKNMQRLHMKGQYYLLCNTPGCCASTKFQLVEAAVVQHLREVLEDLTVEKTAAPSRNTDALEQSLTAIRRELTNANSQKNRLYELLEQGVYDVSTFRERMDAVKVKISGLERKEMDTANEIDRVKNLNPGALAKKIEAVLDAYDNSAPPQRNAMLKSVIRQIWYTKPKKSGIANFQLEFDMLPF